MKMMSKAVIAGIFFMLSGVSAFSVTLSSDEKAKVDLYGKLYFMYDYAGEGQLSGNYSRFGFKASSKVNQTFGVFANSEFRYDASQREKEYVFNDLRNTYVGIDSTFGKVSFGNFDSVYYQAVGANLDLFENYGYVAYDDGSVASRGDSVAYASPEFYGVQLNGQVKHYGKGASVSGDEEYMAQTSATFNLNSLMIGAGAIIANDKSEAVVNEEDGTVTPAYSDNIYGGVIGYTLFEKLTLLSMVEYSEEMNLIFGITYNYGPGTVYTTFGRDWNEDLYGSVGVNYSFSDPMYVFVEFAYGDAIGDDNVFSTGLCYSF